MVWITTLDDGDNWLKTVGYYMLFLLYFWVRESFNSAMVQIKRSLLKNGKIFNIKVILLQLKSWMSKFEHEHFRLWIFTMIHKNFGIRGQFIGIFLELHPQQSKTNNMSRLIISSTYVIYKLQCYKQYRMRCLMKKKVKM